MRLTRSLLPAPGTYRTQRSPSCWPQFPTCNMGKSQHSRRAVVGPAGSGREGQGGPDLLGLAAPPRAQPSCPFHTPVCSRRGGLGLHPHQPMTPQSTLSLAQVVGCRWVSAWGCSGPRLGCGVPGAPSPPSAGWGLLQSCAHVRNPCPSPPVRCLPLGPVPVPGSAGRSPVCTCSVSLSLSPGPSPCLCLGACLSHFCSCDASPFLLFRLSSSPCRPGFPLSPLSSQPSSLQLLLSFFFFFQSPQWFCQVDCP